MRPLGGVKDVYYCLKRVDDGVTRVQIDGEEAWADSVECMSGIRCLFLDQEEIKRSAVAGFPPTAPLCEPLRLFIKGLGTTTWANTLQLIIVFDDSEHTIYIYTELHLPTCCSTWVPVKMVSSFTLD